MSAMTVGWVFFASAFGLGAFTTTVVFVMMRELLIERAIGRREREVYGPLLERVEQQAAAMRARRELECEQLAQRPAMQIRLKSPVSTRHRGGR